MVPGEHEIAPAEAADLYRDMFEHAVLGMFQTSADGRYLSANPALAELYGYPSVAALMSALTDIRHQLYVDPMRRGSFTALMHEQGAVFGFESEVRRLDNRIIWISETCRAVHARDGHLLHYEGTVEDITARKRIEADLRAAKEEAESASRAKSRFIAHMNHEFRTPLNAILGFSQLIRDQSLGPLPAGYIDYARIILDSGTKLLAIMNDVLELVTIETDRLVPTDDVVAVSRLLNACGKEMAAAADAAGLTLRLSLPTGKPLLMADPRRIKKTVLNLLSNAIKFTAPGGTVTLAAESRPDGTLTISVEDNGCGMTEEEVASACDLFSQAEGLMTRRHEGIGMGLPIARAMVELHDGTLTIDSEIGRGTRVTITLPAERVPTRTVDLTLEDTP